MTGIPNIYIALYAPLIPVIVFIGLSADYVIWKSFKSSKLRPKQLLLIVICAEFPNSWAVTQQA